MKDETKQMMTWEEAVLWLRKQPEHAELARACFYDDPLIEAAERYYKSAEWRAVRRYLPAHPGKALDIGAGRGISSYALAKDGWETVALEPDGSNIVGSGAIRALAKEAKLNVRVEETRGERLPFKDGTFDCVFGRQVLHHAGDLDKFCLEVSRVLKRGGIFMAVREHVISRKEDLVLFLQAHPLHRLYGGEHANLLEEYKAALRNAGFKLQHVLNPFSSDINLFPETFLDLKIRVAREKGFPFPRLLPKIYLRYLGARRHEPGRLYTFVGKKNG